MSEFDDILAQLKDLQDRIRQLEQNPVVHEDLSNYDPSVHAAFWDWDAVSEQEKRITNLETDVRELKNKLAVVNIADSAKSLGPRYAAVR